jgi:RNase P subunit RPR2
VSNKGARSEYKKVAEDRILYLLAQIGMTTDTEFGKNCAKIVRGICLRHNIRLKKEQKEVFCKACFSVFRLEKPKVRVKTIKKGGKKLIQKKTICNVCGKETTSNYNKL